MFRILVVTFVFALTACASSKAAEKPAAGGAASATAEVAAEGADPCAGKAGKDLIDCKKANKGQETKFLFKSSGGNDGAAASGGDDDDDE